MIAIEEIVHIREWAEITKEYNSGAMQVPPEQMLRILGALEHEKTANKLLAGSFTNLMIERDRWKSRAEAYERAVSAIHFPVKKGAKFQYDVDYQFLCYTCEYGGAADYIRDGYCDGCYANGKYNNYVFDEARFAEVVETE